MSTFVLSKSTLPSIVTYDPVATIAQEAISSRARLLGSPPANLDSPCVLRAYATNLWIALTACEAERLELRQRYDELIFAVATKCEGESRHQTALRYIRERESAFASVQEARSGA